MDIRIEDYLGKHVHMIGVGGSSMSGLACLLQTMGYTVTGSDNYDSYLVEAVRRAGIPVRIGHDAQNIQGADLVIYSAAILMQNPERAEAQRRGVAQMERATLLGQLMRGYRQAIAVAGTHGKTTTTAMLAQALVQAGLDPSVHIGGNFDFINGSTRVGAQEVFVAEACEFHSSFLQMHPTVAVVLNIEEDHLDYYKDIDDIVHAFGEFIALLPAQGVFVGNGDDVHARELMRREKKRRVVSFGMSEDCDWRAENLVYDALGCGTFDAALRGKVMAHVSLRVGGAFNVMNALAALAAAHAVNADMQAVAAALSSFENVHRRFEHTGTVDGVLLYHDYGHNPTEMRAALSLAKKRPHSRLWAVMQPHTYSRVKRLFDSYIHCCEDADEILVTDICAAREVDPGDIHSGMLVDAMAAAGQRVHLTPTFDDTEAYLRAHWSPGDIVLTMGCGNINELNEQINKHG